MVGHRGSQGDVVAAGKKFQDFGYLCIIAMIILLTVGQRIMGAHT